MSDDGFHEIQLNGKQLIFLFMAAALVLVVAFLSGVLVGRGVRVQKDAAVAAADSGAVNAGPAEPVPAAPAGVDTRQPAPPPVTAIAPPTPADEELSYSSRLVDAQPPAEKLKPAEQQAADKAPRKETGKSPVAAPPVAQPKTAPPPQAADAAVAKSKVDASLAGEPTGDGYYLKIAALRDRGQADGLAKRLTGKGYSTYIVPLSGRGPVLYSVRVGKYKTRREADMARRRLEKEEQFKPLISH